MLELARDWASFCVQWLSCDSLRHSLGTFLFFVLLGAVDVGRGTLHGGSSASSSASNAREVHRG